MPRPFWMTLAIEMSFSPRIPATREAVPVVIVTHEARERDMRAALAKIDRLRDVTGATTMIRVEGGPE